MNFYRLATEEDFKKRYEVNIDYFMDYLPEEVERLIENGEFILGVKKLREFTGRGIEECKKFCLKYQAYVKAKRDFYDGNPVYTEY